MITRRNSAQSLPQVLPKWRARRGKWGRPAAGGPFKPRWRAGLGVWGSFSKRESDQPGVWRVER